MAGPRPGEVQAATDEELFEDMHGASELEGLTRFKALGRLRRPICQQSPSPPALAGDWMVSLFVCPSLPHPPRGCRDIWVLAWDLKLCRGCYYCLFFFSGVNQLRVPSCRLQFCKDRSCKPHFPLSSTPSLLWLFTFYHGPNALYNDEPCKEKATGA